MMFRIHVDRVCNRQKKDVARQRPERLKLIIVHM